MSAPVKKEYTMEELEGKYSDVTRLYDLAEELVATVESSLVSNPDLQLAVVEPLINEIGEATDVLAEEFLFIAESKKHKNSSKASKKRIEAGLRRLFAAVADYQARVANTTKKAHGAILNIADPIVTKITRHIEKIVVIFLEFVQISLTSIMGKAELETLKARDARIALMMHAQALQQQG